MQICEKLAKSLVWILFIVAYVSPASSAGELQITLYKTKPAVVLILCSVEAEVAGTGPYPVGGGTGSGFIINPNGYIITNGHVVADAHESNKDWMNFKARLKYIETQIIPKIESENKIKMTAKQKEEYINGNYSKYQDLKVSLKRDIEVILSNRKSYPAEVKEYSPPISSETGESIHTIANIHFKKKTGKDVSLLKIEARNLPTVELGNSEAVSIGETVHLIGYPGAARIGIISQESNLVEQTISTGSITAGKRDIKGTAFIQIDASASPGNSGGPCINSKGEVIGILSYGHGETINWLVPINTAKEFIRAAGIDTRERSLFDKDWERALRAFADKELSISEEAVKNVLIFMPDQPDAIRLLRRIKEITPEMEKQKSKGVNWKKIVLMVSIAGMIILVILFVITGKKKGQTIIPKAQDSTRVASVPGTQDLGILIGRSAPFKDKRFPMGSTGFKIGRDSFKNDIVIQHEEASREHAWIGPEEGKIVLKDLNSTNGTYLNSVSSGSIQKTLVNPGDVIIIGKSGEVSFIYQKG